VTRSGLAYPEVSFKVAMIPSASWRTVIHYSGDFPINIGTKFSQYTYVNININVFIYFNIYICLLGEILTYINGEIPMKKKGNQYLRRLDLVVFVLN
jgi:hypothetical protein